MPKAISELPEGERSYPPPWLRKTAAHWVLWSGQRFPDGQPGAPLSWELSTSGSGEPAADIGFSGAPGTQSGPL
jgi:hypothetical protein